MSRCPIHANDLATELSTCASKVCALGGHAVQSCTHLHLLLGGQDGGPEVEAAFDLTKA